MNRIVITLLAAVPAAAQPPSASVRSLAFSDDGTRLAAAFMPPGRGGAVWVWDTASRKLIAKYDRAGESPGIAFSRDGKSIPIANGRKLVPIIDPATGQKTGDLGPFPSEVTSIRRGPRDQWFVLGKDNRIRLWDVTAKKELRSFGSGRGVRNWTASPSGNWVFASGDEGRKLWKADTGEEVDVLKNIPGVTMRATFLGDDRLLTGSNSIVHRLFEIPSGKELLRFKHEGGAEGLAYSSATGILVNRHWNGPTASVTRMTFRAPTEAERTKLAAILKDWDSDDYDTREKAASKVLELGWPVEPLLRQTVESGPSAEVRMRARVAREEILNKPNLVLQGHTDDIRPIEISPDGKLIATGGADGLVILWDSATGKEVGRMNVNDRPSGE